uniref:Transcription factor IIIC 90kDa subunit N-terminal domain-containing protein n=1 Tax=Ceratitis capitata TaxID=7213 RepID=W8BFU6_CERCA
MSQLKLKKLHLSELKQEICADIGIVSTEDQIALQCSNNQLIILDLLNSSTDLTDLPYNLYYVEIPQNYNLGTSSKSDLSRSYNSSSLLEQQQRVLNPKYVGHFSCEPPKVNALQFKQAAWSLCREQSLAVIVTDTGLCQILKKKNVPSRHWSAIFNINDCFLDRLSSSKIIGCSEEILSKLFTECYITSAVWHRTKQILFISFKIGYVAALLFTDAFNASLKEIFITKMELNNICDINLFDHYMLISSRDGILQLFSLNSSENSNPVITPLAFLWTKIDNLTCNKIIIKKFSPSINLVVFNKAAHIFVYALSTEGNIICSNSIYVGGIKITGVQFTSSTEFIVTTITNSIHYFRVLSALHNELKISEQVIEHELNALNLGILGVVYSLKTRHFTFILMRVGEYTQQCKYMHSSIFVNISKLEDIDAQSELINSYLSEINPSQDNILNTSFDIFSNLENYNSFSDIINLTLPDILDDKFLLQMQTKFVLASNILSCQRSSQKRNKESTILAYKFLLTAIQIVHIICRLKFLLSLESASLSIFLQETIHVFRNKYKLLLHDLKTLSTEQIFVKQAIETYLKFFTRSFNANVGDINAVWTEKCLYCNNFTNADTMMCDKNHKVKRCSVSHVQLPIITTRHCPRCQYYALDDENQLQELFAENESVKCTFCRSVLVVDCI